MRKIIVFLLIAFIQSRVEAFAQIATVVEDITSIDYQSPTNCTTTKILTIRINNEQGLSLASFVLPCDKSTSLTSFSGSISYPEGAAKIKNIKKNELQKTEYSSHLASDSYYFFYNPSPASYPFTITYEWTYHEAEAILSFESFTPQPGCDVNVERASYSITYPENTQIHHHLVNMQNEVREETIEGGKKKLTIEVNNLAAIKQEKMMPSLKKVLPIAYLVPDKFEFNKTQGSLSSWETFGSWLSKLQDSRDVLPEELKQKLHSMTDSCSTSYGKVLQVYRLLEESTRYVSIQLGIGGLQPAPAAEVCQRGFGDCKGLANYTVAMLREVGVDANYVVIGTNSIDLPTSFAMPSMLNHAIARVNLPNDTLWVECTNPKYPLGYVHQDIAGHNAIVITDKGGEKVRLPQYNADDNKDVQTISVDVKNDGSATISALRFVMKSKYEDFLPLFYADKNKQREILRNQLQIADFSFNAHNVNELMRQDRMKDERQPLIMIKLDGECGKFTKTTGSRVFLNLSPMDCFGTTSATVARTNPIQIAGYDFTRTQNIKISIPEEYSIEHLPAAVNEESDCGIITSSIKADNNTINVSVTYSLKSDLFTKDRYEEVCAFLNKISALLSSKIVLKKNS